MRPIVARLPLPVLAAVLEIPAAHGATGGVLENFDALGIAAVLDIAGSLHSDDVLLRIGRVGGGVKLVRLGRVGQRGRGFCFLLVCSGRDVALALFRLGLDLGESAVVFAPWLR